MTNNPLNCTWYVNNTNLQVNSVCITDDGSKCVFGTSYERGSGDFKTCLYDGQGSEIWSKPIATETTYQGVFWVAISGDGNYVASGGETTEKYTPGSPQGFLKAYKADSEGAELLSATPNYRVNQVSLSQDGTYLAVCYEKTLEVFQLNAESTAYTSIFSQQHSCNINSCVISRDGSTVIASGILYNDDSSDTDSTTTGKVYSYSVNAGSVTAMGACSTPTGSMRVAVVDSGYFWTASLHDGSCMLFSQKDPNSMVWHCTPEDQPNLELAYAVDITQTDQGDVYVACGANLYQTDPTQPGGFLYLVQSVLMVYDDNQIKYPEPYFSPVVQWTSEIEFGVNPGVSLDHNATLVTATDGKPDGQTVKESAGSFYLIDAQSGQQIWKNDTEMMNWPMMLARDGQSVMGGSDTGSVYYWQLSE